MIAELDELRELGWYVNDFTAMDEEPEPDSEELYTHVAAGTATQEQRFIITPDDSQDSIQGHGEFIAIDTDLVESLEKSR